jgi:hypothetical protein
MQAAQLDEGLAGFSSTAASSMAAERLACLFLFPLALQE